jgi:hypothetical protein
MVGEKKGGSPWGSSTARFFGQGVDVDGSTVTTSVGEEVDEVRRVLVSPQVASSSRLPSCNVDWRRPEIEAVSVRCRRGWSRWFAGKSDERMVSPSATKHEKGNEIRERARGHLNLSQSTKHIDDVCRLRRENTHNLPVFSWNQKRGKREEKEGNNRASSWDS